MSVLALILVLSSAVLHATWNWLAKRAAGGIPFVWLFSALSATIYLPIVIITLLTLHPLIGNTEIVFMLGSSMLHLGYFFLLNRGYQVGDLSLVYPLSRGTGPVLAVVGAVALFGERPSSLAVVGIALVTSGVFILTGDLKALRRNGTAPAVIYGLLTGLVIAVYTLWDKLVVAGLLIPPLVLIWFSTVVRTLALIPYVLRHRSTVASLWRSYPKEALGIAVLDTLSYILFLAALTFSPVSYLSPARQISILLGAFLGVRLLAESDARRRFIAAGVMLIGLVALTLG
ncbi:MAG: EamA family transporter [Anaerolineaceae bacterium]|nr:EamA family transporter [Anaerolineaceae bacterium]